METVTIASIFSNVKTVAGECFDMVGDVFETIFSNPALMLTFCLGLAMIGIGIVKQLFGVRL